MFIFTGVRGGVSHKGKLLNIESDILIITFLLPFIND